MLKIELHILKWCLDPVADIELLKIVVALLIFVLKIGSFRFRGIMGHGVG